MIAVVTKTDLVGPEKLAEHLLAVSALADFAESCRSAPSPVTRSTSSPT